MMTHRDKKPYKCKYCDKSYCDHRSLKRHYENYHPNPERPVPITTATHKTDTEILRTAKSEGRFTPDRDEGRPSSLSSKHKVPQAGFGRKRNSDSMCSNSSDDLGRRPDNHSPHVSFDKPPTAVSLLKQVIDSHEHKKDKHSLEGYPRPGHYPYPEGLHPQWFSPFHQAQMMKLMQFNQPPILVQNGPMNSSYCPTDPPQLVPNRTLPDAAMAIDSSNFRWPNETSSEASSSVPDDAAMVEDSSNFRWPNETSSEVSSSANKVRRLKKRGKSVDMIALKNKDDDEPTITDTIGSQKPTQESKRSSKESPMCSSCASKDKTPLSSDRDKWPIGKIEFGCFRQICKLLDLADSSKEPLLSALGGFDQTTAAYIEKKYEIMRVGIAKEVLDIWGSSSHENNVGALKKILKHTMQRIDVVDEIENWENLSVCHGCGIKCNKPH
ncbi:Transcriptional-regulating factor 1 [Paramuricea clavata]|uniref:Transcriptional-regulating factor 1 n=1 Tax=Paramuricea clavata TaxID=317549 RepID=A0A6S7HCG0_PARCT|nr:Transcriptional-regulating factor 1 [Paramuricea clavata]